MISIFNFRAYLTIFVMMVIIITMVVIGLLIEVNTPDILMFMIFNAVLAPFILYEFRNKIVSIMITNSQISKSSYFALDKVYEFKTFDGFQTKVVKGNFKDYECLYLIKNGVRVITLSQIYHKNYDELKTKISEKSKNLGTSEHNLFDKLTEIVAFTL